MSPPQVGFRVAGPEYRDYIRRFNAMDREWTREVLDRAGLRHFCGVDVPMLSDIERIAMARRHGLA
jgi:DNA-directed RNA polymerase subunit N (RpoN/RPB10)